MSGATAVLTGVTGGWGRAVLDRFCEQGWNVAVTHRGEAPGDLPAGVLAVEADLTDPASAERVVAAAGERFGGVEALANIAGGYAAAGTVDEAPVDVWRSQMAVNLDTAYHMTRAALAPMRAAGRGAIVYIGSSATERPFPGAAGYIASKTALVGLMRAVDAEVQDRGHSGQHRRRENRRHAPEPGREPRRRPLSLDDRGRAGHGDRVAVLGRVRAALGWDDPGVWPRPLATPASCSPTWPPPSRPPGRALRCGATTSGACSCSSPRRSPSSTDASRRWARPTRSAPITPTSRWSTAAAGSRSRA